MLTPKDLVGRQEYLARGIDGGELVEFSIFNNYSVTPGYTTEVTIGHYDDIIYARNHDSEQESFIRSVFERLDPLLDLDFYEGDSSGTSDINIHRSWYNSYYKDGDRLNNEPTNGTGGGTAHYDFDHIDISWKDYYGNDPFTDAERMTIVHEIGHAMGLIDLARDPRWDTYDSIMSYNHPENLPIQTWFTDADIAAMQSIWGVEDDHIQPPASVVTRGSNYDDNLVGGSGNDELTGLRGKDYLIGYEGDDILRAGNGRDVITGGNGADALYGGFGANTFTSEIDGAEDWLFINSDQHGHNYIYGKAGNNAGDQKCDNIMGLDSFDMIFIQGVNDSDLYFGWTTLQSSLGTLEGIGIWAGESLEAIYTGGNLSVDQVVDMTWGAPA